MTEVDFAIITVFFQTPPETETLTILSKYSETLWRSFPSLDPIAAQLKFWRIWSLYWTVVLPLCLQTWLSCLHCTICILVGNVPQIHSPFHNHTPASHWSVSWNHLHLTVLFIKNLVLRASISLILPDLLYVLHCFLMFELWIVFGSYHYSVFKYFLPNIEFTMNISCFYFQQWWFLILLNETHTVMQFRLMV